MSAAKHTPGPWVTNGFNVFGPVDQSSKHQNGRVLVGGVVDDMNDWRGRPVGDPIDRAEFREERIANANLIAAAPDLLAALKAIAESSGRYDEPEHDADPIEHALMMRDIALAAIAKAEGR